MKFAKNQLLKFNAVRQGESITERILWVDTDYTYCFTIDIKHKKARPQISEILSLHRLFENKELEVLQKDPYNILFVENELSKSEIRIRDHRWDLIKDLVLKEPEIYDFDQIGKVVEKYHVEKNPSKTSIYQNLRYFWQKGNVKNALVPNYRNCGNRGYKKNLRESKTGRPKTYNVKQIGINVTNEVEYYFKKGIKKFKESNVTTIKDIYHFILNEYFVDHYVIENGEKKVELNNDIPSLRQFQYWYSHNSGLSSKQKNIHRKGKNQHHLLDRPVLDKLVIPAPGLQFQIDSTPGDIYLVSEKSPDLVIGKPTIYFLRDTFSRMIVGLYVGLQEASWQAATMALVNTITNKVKFCEELGIEISEEEWPTHYFPDSLLTDRGPEFKGYKPEQFINNFGVRVENTPTGRADYKGSIEQYFNMVNRKLKKHLPGTVTKDSHKRGERDPRLDARLTLKQYIEAILHAVLFYNNDHWLKKYDLDEEMIADNVPKIPIELWKWGMENRSGRLREYSEDYVKLNLLPRITGKVTKFGIHLIKDMYYTCGQAKKDNWFQDAALSGSWDIKLAYDPRSTNEVYIYNQDASYEVCYLLPKCKKFQDMHFDDFVAVRTNQKESEKRYERTEIEAELEFNNNISEIANSAQTTYEERTLNPNKSSKLKNIRQNKKEAREENYEKEAIRLSRDKNEETEIDKNIENQDEPMDDFVREEINAESDYLFNMEGESRNG